MPARWWSEELFVPAGVIPPKISHTLLGTAIPLFQPITPTRNGSVLTLRPGLCVMCPRSSDLDSVDFAAATSHPHRGRPGVWLQQSLGRRRVPGGSVHLLATHLPACHHWLHRGDAGR